MEFDISVAFYSAVMSHFPPQHYATKTLILDLLISFIHQT